MTKPLAALLSAMLVLAATALPSSAGPKKKVITQEWSVTALPFPGADDHSNPAEECGVEGISYDLHAFTTPGRGTLDLRIDQFQGEWDLYVTDADGNVLGSSVQFMSSPEEQVTIAVGPKAALNIYSCNFLGGPTAHAELKYTY